MNNFICDCTVFTNIAFDILEVKFVSCLASLTFPKITLLQLIRLTFRFLRLLWRDLLFFGLRTYPTSYLCSWFRYLDFDKMLFKIIKVCNTIPAGTYLIKFTNHLTLETFPHVFIFLWRPFLLLLRFLYRWLILIIFLIACRFNMLIMWFLRCLRISLIRLLSDPTIFEISFHSIFE